jgi:hypothetical protein
VGWGGKGRGKGKGKVLSVTESCVIKAEAPFALRCETNGIR